MQWDKPYVMGEGCSVTIRILEVRRIKQAGVLLLFAAATGLLLRFPAAAATGVSRGLSVCGEVIIPSLFPFLVLTGLFIRTGTASRVGRRMGRVMRRLFGVSADGGVALLIGMIGGYPAGAVAVRELLDRGEIDRREAARLLTFCINGGPAFIIGTVGARLLGSAYKGILLYIAHLLASLFLAFFSSKSRCQSCEKLPPVRSASFSSAFPAAIERALASVLTMSGFVLLFSALITLSEASGIKGVLLSPFTGSKVADALYTAVWEVSCGSMELVSCRIGGPLMAFLLGTALGFGGVSVSAQIGGMLSEYLPLGRSYWFGRVKHALLGGVLSALLFAFVPMPPNAVSTAVSPNTVTAIHPFAVSAAASAALLLLCGGVMLCTAKE